MTLGIPDVDNLSGAEQKYLQWKADKVLLYSFFMSLIPSREVLIF